MVGGVGPLICMLRRLPKTRLKLTAPPFCGCLPFVTSYSLRSFKRISLGCTLLQPCDQQAVGRFASTPSGGTMRRRFVLVACCMLLSTPMAAQQTVSPGTFCWRARPMEHCRAIILTNAGGYLVSGPASGPGAVADWGVLVNAGARTALGASLFASQTRYGFLLGPAVHYRRWLGPHQSIDLALGTRPCTVQQAMRRLRPTASYGITPCTGSGSPCGRSGVAGPTMGNHTRS
jgi:hypothetical protein